MITYKILSETSERGKLTEQVRKMLSEARTKRLLETTRGHTEDLHPIDTISMFLSRSEEWFLNRAKRGFIRRSGKWDFDFLVAIRGKEVLGCVLFHRPAKSDYYLGLHTIVVNPKYENEAIDKQLYHRLEKLAENRFKVPMITPVGPERYIAELLIKRRNELRKKARPKQQRKMPIKRRPAR